VIAIAAALAVLDVPPIPPLSLERAARMDAERAARATAVAA
jgi:hypothetical protein